jgi:hypothetical protein
VPPGPWSTAQRTLQQGVSAGILARLRHHSIDAPPSPPTEAFVKVVTYFWVRARVGGGAILHAVRPQLRDLCRLFGRCQVICDSAQVHHRSLPGIWLRLCGRLSGHRRIYSKALCRGQRAAAVYLQNAAFNRWTGCQAVLLTPLAKRSPIFTPLYHLKWPVLSTRPSDQVAKGQRQRSSPQIN